jgi:translocator protein
MSLASLLALAGFLAMNFAASATGAIFRPGEWYEGLRKPWWTPPNLAFPIVWSTLFLANAVAGWLVWEAAGVAALPALVLYVVSLALNAGWSFVFFGLRRMRLALAEVALLWLSIAAVMLAFWPIRPLATLLIAPYLAWVTIAAALNLRLVQLNPKDIERS